MNISIRDVDPVAIRKIDELAKKKGISRNEYLKNQIAQIAVMKDLNEIEKHMKIYEFTRILGILLDNAIEASSECDEKVIHVSFRKEDNRHRLIMGIENTYKNKDINVDKIFEKDFSTKSKKSNSGLGLWEVRQILKKNNNLNLFTSKNDEFFSQQFEIYY